MSRRRWSRRLVPLLPAAVLLVVLAGSARAAYQSTADVNHTAFNPPCDGDVNPFTPKMLDAAGAAYRAMGYTGAEYGGAQFTKAHVLARTVNDWGYYVHSHGDKYLNPDGKRYTGFREDSGDCSQSVVFSKEILAKRNGRQSNLVFISTCHAADGTGATHGATTMPGAFAIAKTKTVWPNSQGPEFYVGYVGVQWDSDEWVFEQRYWNSLTGGKSVGDAFKVAAAGAFNAGFKADWWGTYIWSGKAGPWDPQCPSCQ